MSRVANFSNLSKCINFISLHSSKFKVNRYVLIRDETIRSLHDTIRIDTKGDDMIIYDMIWVVIVKIQKKSQYSLYFIYDHLEDKHNRRMFPLVSITNTLAIRFTKELDKNKYFC